MVDDRCPDPVQAVKDILADGPVAAPEFRRLAYAAGITIRQLSKAAKAAGAECCRFGRPGRKAGEGGWVWQLKGGVDRFIKTHPSRSGYYADNIFLRGKEIQCKLADDLDTARVKVAELLKERDAERERDKLARKKAPPPPVPHQSRSPRPVVVPLPVQLRNVARDLYRLAKVLETSRP